jgi:hypothetical protein
MKNKAIINLVGYIMYKSKACWGFNNAELQEAVPANFLCLLAVLVKL